MLGHFVDVGRVTFRSVGAALHVGNELFQLVGAAGDNFGTHPDQQHAGLAAFEAEITDAGCMDVLGSLIGVEDVRDRWGGLDLDQERGVIDALMMVTLFSRGRGSRSFDPATVRVVPTD